VSTRATIEVGHLPTHAFGPRDPLWWGLMGMVLVETLGFAMIATTYFYVRGNFVHWPPTPMSHQSLLCAAIGTVSVLASGVATHFTNRAALRADIRGIQIWVGVTLLLSLIFLAARAYEIQGLPFGWDRHAYGSAFWLLLGMHTFHGITGTLETSLLFAYFVGHRPIEEKYLVDAHTSGLYWYFVVLTWIPIGAILYLDPLWFAR
jgi:cytochrome c oxidase subunit 3